MTSESRPCSKDLRSVTLCAGSKELEAAQHNPRMLSVILISQKLVGFNKGEVTEALLPLVSADCSNKLQKPFIFFVLKETTTSTCQ